LKFTKLIPEGMFTFPVQYIIKSVNKNKVIADIKISLLGEQDSRENVETTIDQLVDDDIAPLMIIKASNKSNELENIISKYKNQLPIWAKEYSPYICYYLTRKEQKTLGGCIDIEKNEIKFPKNE